jgi:isocitrate dehydrogenase
MKSTIFYTLTDEAPALATRSLLPIVRAFVSKADINVETSDISLAGRILAAFSPSLPGDQRVEDGLAQLGRLVNEPGANVIKLPNISASLPQLNAAVAELQKLGYALPDYPEEPKNEKEREVKARYDRVKGSAVNPVLREGNSDRRAPGSVKEFARKNPHSMGAWSKDSLTHVASMSSGDFYGSEKSCSIKEEGSADIVFKDSRGNQTILKQNIPLLKDEIIDAAVMSKKALAGYFKEQMDRAKEENILLSLHLKATMMKVSDPIIFGIALKTFFAPLFEKHEDLLNKAGVDPNNGLGDLYSKIKVLSSVEQDMINKEIETCLENGPDLAMVDSDRGITNFHVPSDIIIDASMPAAIRKSGKMWNSQGQPQDTKALIPDRAYAGIYQAAIEDCREKGAFDPVTMGSVSNVGLMAQKAEEYGSHDKTFQIRSAGTVNVIDQNGKVLLELTVEEGDIFRMCQVKDAPVRNWIDLALSRGRLTGQKVVFWLDSGRAHDREIKAKVESYLAQNDTTGLDIYIMSPDKACRFSMEEIRAGRDIISVTGNVLRDYLTDLFPILEVGTSAKMLSIVPLMKGGGLFETGAGGSAPKHVQQFTAENHLRWDSLGEFLALSASLEYEALKRNNDEAGILAETLDSATGRLLDERKSPSRKAGEIDNRGSHFILALYWAEALANQEKNEKMKGIFTPLAKSLAENKVTIEKELIQIQGLPVDLKGYYKPNEELIGQVMRPSPVFNKLIDNF